MIGLFGLWRRDAAAPADIAALTTRHPAGIAVESLALQGAGLGIAAHMHSRCLSRARQDDIAVFVSGEIFEAEKLDPQAKDAADLILRFYREDKLDRLAEANGQFAAALYDGGKHKLVLIADRLASVPLHYWSDDQGLVFATQLYTLLGEPRIPRRADPLGLAELFTLQRTIADHTPVQGVKALPAAHILQQDRNGISLRPYWHLHWRKPDFNRSEGAERLAAALRAALTRQSDGQDVGLLLSGGLDSRLVLAAADRKPLCWTTASFEDNPELALARTVAAGLHAQHRTVLVDPAETLAIQDETTRDGGGMFPASTSVAAFMPRVAQESSICLTGHGLDYTLRGYYLPSRFLRLGGSNTRLPMLAELPARPDAAYLFNRLRQGPPRSTIERIVRPARQADWFGGQVNALSNWLAPWLNSDEPVNAWDAFILAQVSKHYAFTSMAAVRGHTDLRIPAFDIDVLNVYLSMPPQWRVEATMTQQAMRLLSPEIARLPNANTGFRADLNSWAEIGALLGRAALRRLGLASRPQTPSDSHSAGSWQNLTALFREDPAHRAHFTAIRGRLDALSFGLFDTDALAACIDEHLDGHAKHTKLLRQLLTHDSWVRVFGIA
ncbi:asparagine synthase-related protein [Ferrovibrio sp.]|uniref:asparagine synthase-related protein n=1 Tax=Ferrovibrio sp. TaxID=1917215 RepID=UPI0035B00611